MCGHYKLWHRSCLPPYLFTDLDILKNMRLNFSFESGVGEWYFGVEITVEDRVNIITQISDHLRHVLDWARVSAAGQARAQGCVLSEQRKMFRSVSQWEQLGHGLAWQHLAPPANHKHGHEHLKVHVAMTHKVPQRSSKAIGSNTGKMSKTELTLLKQNKVILTLTTGKERAI